MIINKTIVKVLGRAGILVMISFMVIALGNHVLLAKSLYPKEPKAYAQYNNNNQVKLSWKKVSGATGYVVYRSKKEKKGFKAIKVLKRSRTSYKTKRPKTGKYYFKIKAYKKSKGYYYYSNYSSCWSAVPALTTNPNPSSYPNPNTNVNPNPSGYGDYVKVQIPCTNGTDGKRTCSTCRGTGRMDVLEGSIWGSSCRTCNGTGRMTCVYCGGMGYSTRWEWR